MEGNSEKFFLKYILMMNDVVMRSRVAVGCTIKLRWLSLNTLLWTVKCDDLKLCYSV